jgi:hypothetical protein
MSFDTMFINFTGRVSQFWLNTAKRLKEAKDAGSKYTADQFAASAAGTVVDAIDIWSSVFVDVPVPVVPTIFMSDKAAAFKLGVSAQGSVTFDVPSSVAITVTDLGALGGGTPIPGKAVTVTASGTQLSVAVKTSGVPAAGTYLGVAFVGPFGGALVPQALAQIVVVVV